MAISYKQKCMRCKKNYILANYRTRYATCYECQKKELNGEIKDPKLKKMFDIPEEYYKENSFLRNIKINYLKYENLTEKQVETFKKVVKEKKEKTNDKE